MAELLEKDLVYKIIGCAITVLNEIGHGLREKTYENALCLEFNRQSMEYEKQTKYPVYYREQIVDEFIPDLIVKDRVIVEIKTVETLIDEHRGQLINYLRITGKKVDLLLNFNHPKLQWERLVLDKNRTE